MRITPQIREVVRGKYNGLCAYSGTPLEDDWQVDHLEPVRRHPLTGAMEHPERDCIDNLVPCQKHINNYKTSMSVDELRSRQWLGGLHIRLAKLPKNPRTAASVTRIMRMNRLAAYFGITPTTPFSGTFHFEKIISHRR
jgi:hypothetical protein